MQKPTYQFEICTNSVASCLAAQEGGAHRVELCASIPEGGTTPSWGEIAVARELLQIKLHVIIRPRGGDFVYSPIEVKTMVKDIEMAKEQGVDGVVFGCLTPTGEIDKPAMQKLMKASKGVSVTFHRAFDVCSNPKQALEEIIELGCQRVLTSGQQLSADKGISLLKELHQQANGRIILLAGCGVNENNIAHIAAETGIKEFHFSAREAVSNPWIAENAASTTDKAARLFDYERMVTTAKRVKNTIEAVTQQA